MANELSIWSLFLNASLLVKGIMVFLFVISIISWAMIIQRYLALKDVKRKMSEFEERFWTGLDIRTLYDALTVRFPHVSGLEHIFHAGYKEYHRLAELGDSADNQETALHGAERAMRVALSREADKLEKHLSFLATVGSTSPYVGLFGTVWGIMHSFLALGQVKQATLAMVAPGIAEALIATAMGLFAAIPAVVAYNRFTHSTEKFINHYDNFREELFSLLQRMSQQQRVAV